jgi:hypothetical protein
MVFGGFYYGVRGLRTRAQEDYEKMGRFIQELAQRGVLLLTDGLQHTSKGARVRIQNGTFTVTDGPFTEAKEVVAGYAIIDVKTKAEAIELTKRFLSLMGKGESEVRLMPDQPAYQRA